MSEAQKIIENKKKICLMPKKQFRKLPGKYEEVEIDLGQPHHPVFVVIHRSIANGKLYILPDEFSKIPTEIQHRLNIKDIRPSAISKKKQLTAKQGQVVVISDAKLRIIQETACIVPTTISLRPAGRHSIQNINGYKNTAGSITYISLDVYSMLSAYMKEQLNIQNADEVKEEMLTKKAQLPKRTEKVIHSGKIVVADNSIRNVCRRIWLNAAGEMLPVTGHISEATGSLLIPAKNFSKEVPIEVRAKLNWEDPIGYLRQYEGRCTSGSGEWSALNTQSILHRYGYSVKASVSKEYRQEVLGRIVQDGLVSRAAVLSHIRSLISRNTNRYPVACARWKEDVEFVKNLQE